MCEHIVIVLVSLCVHIDSFCLPHSFKLMFFVCSRNKVGWSASVMPHSQVLLHLVCLFSSTNRPFLTPGALAFLTHVCTLFSNGLNSTTLLLLCVSTLLRAETSYAHACMFYSLFEFLVAFTGVPSVSV